MPTNARTLVALGASLALLLATACSGDDDDGAGAAGGASGDEAGTTAPESAEVATPYGDYQSDLYAGDENWLCKPGRDDVCARDLDATVVAADGSTEVEQLDPADDPPVDCFYVYPTTSRDEGPTSDLDPAEGEEISTAYNQVARMTSVCRVFAPVYRQGTLSAIAGGGGGDGGNPMADAYGDVLDAFKQYIVNESDGRPFVLIGHSQGASHLSRLVAEEIDDEPLLRDRMVSALLLGWPVSVPEGEVVGGAFQNVPLCQATDQTGCVVSYSSFRSTAPPPAGSLFGRPFGGGGGQAACVNPARPEGGGPAMLHPYFLVDQAEGALLGGQGAQPFADPSRTAEITTPFVTYPDLVEAECVSENGFTYLSLTVHGDPSDPRTDDIGGDLTPEWGMHLVDVNVAMGDLVDLVAKQSEAFASHGSEGSNSPNGS